MPNSSVLVATITQSRSSAKAVSASFRSDALSDEWDTKVRVFIVRNDNAIIVLDGVVQSSGANGRFRLNDTEVETTAANAALATVGSRVQVKGRKTAGVLMATDFRRVAAGERIQYVVQGDIANFVSNANFTVRGESINAATATFIGGSAANLANGRTVRIRAQAIAGHLEAIEVSFVTG